MSLSFSSHMHTYLLACHKKARITSPMWNKLSLDVISAPSVSAISAPSRLSISVSKWACVWSTSAFWSTWSLASLLLFFFVRLYVSSILQFAWEVNISQQQRIKCTSTGGVHNRITTSQFTCFEQLSLPM